MWKAHAAMVVVQLNYGAYHVITKLALTVGVNQLVFCILRDAIALAILAPLAFLKERRRRLPLNCRILFSFFFLGMTGIFANQLLFMLGLSMTSPAYAAALQPAIPVFTFLLALLTGTESINWNELSGKAKLGGTFICTFGAVLTALYKGPSIWGDSFDDMHMPNAMGGTASPKPIGWLADSLLEIGLEQWHIGIFCLIGNCLSMALYIAFQASFLARYPAELSVTAYSYAFGAALMALTGLFTAHDSSDWDLTHSEIFSVLFAGVVASALNYSLLTWSNKVIGPALVALYMPLQPLASSIFSRLFLGSSIYLGSIIGGGCIIVGLYLVTWGRRETERLSGAGPHRRTLTPSEYHNGNSGSSITDPFLKFFQRGFSHQASSSLPLSRKVDKL